MRVAVAGATGLAGRHVCRELERRHVDLSPLARAVGVDLVSGEGLDRALEGVTVVIDASAVVPPSPEVSRRDAVVRAAGNLVAACEGAGVGRIVLLSIINVDHPGFDDFAYYRAKREQEALVRASSGEHAVVRSAQWFEFATNPAAVTFDEQSVLVQDWLIQPLAVASVAEVLVSAAVGGQPTDVTVAGPDVVRLPELTRRYLTSVGDPRTVRPRPALLPAFADGALLADAGTQILQPDLSTWTASRRTTDPARDRA